MSASPNHIWQGLKVPLYPPLHFGNHCLHICVISHRFQDLYNYLSVCISIQFKTPGRFGCLVLILFTFFFTKLRQLFVLDYSQLLHQLNGFTPLSLCQCYM